MLLGKLFHNFDAATEKDLSPVFLERPFFSINKFCDADLRLRGGIYEDNNSIKYFGAKEWMHFKVKRLILNLILSEIGSQCSFSSKGRVFSFEVQGVLQNFEQVEDDVKDNQECHIRWH